MDCRSIEKRQWIIENYNVTPVAHIQLLAGQTKHSDAGKIIQNDYYIFEAVDKSNGEKEIIQCGMGAARDFLRLLNHKGLPIFNPLHRGELVGGGENGRARAGGDVRRGETNWNPIARQLYNAIMWIIIIIDAKPDTPIFEIRDKVYRYKDREPFSKQIRAVNTIIRKNLPNTTLTEAINNLRVENDVRDDVCQFELLVNSINNMTNRDGLLLDIQSLF